MKRVLITAPLRQEIKIFKEYQKALDRLIIPEGVTVDRFYVVNDCPEIIPEITSGSYTVINTGDLYKKTDTDHLWTYQNLDKMPLLRNRTIEAAKGFDYWWSIDTDLIVQPETLVALLEADKDIVSEVFWSTTQREWCNAWLYDQLDDGGMSKMWKYEGLYRVGGTGACALVKTSAFDKGLSYSPIPNIRRALWGEDRWFSIRAAVLGIEMWLDTHYPAEHLFTDDLYNDYMRRINNDKHN